MEKYSKSEPKFGIVPYSIDTLNRLLAEHSEADLEIIAVKRHSDYFAEYFEAINARTIVVESDYIDHDFLEDFSGYYVRCFHSYRHRCARLHFFNRDFRENDFDDLLNGDRSSINQNDLKESYLGFIVIKPLPQTVVGRTCLRTYPEEKGRKFLSRPYEAHLFGFTLQVETLAFQEQDKVAAACATSALWSLFQGTGVLFQHSIPSPVEITKSAATYTPVETRNLPNNGLTPSQMAHAIRNISLEPFVVSGNDEHVLKNTLYAYLQGRTPLLMIVYLVDTSVCPPKLMGQHGVTVTGYRLGHSNAIPHKSSGFLSKASRIDRIYVHDDQIGPFARMKFDDVEVDWGASETGKERWSLSTSWIGDNQEAGSVRAVVNKILIPLYNKIRIPYETIQGVVFYFDAFIEDLRAREEIEDFPLDQRLEWDISLTMVNDLKSEIFSANGLEQNSRKKILLESLPRFLWRASAYDGQTLTLDFLFDATDIEQGPFFLRAIEYDTDISKVLSIYSNRLIQKGMINATSPIWKIIKWFEQNPEVE